MRRSGEVSKNKSSTFLSVLILILALVALMPVAAYGAVQATYLNGSSQGDEAFAVAIAADGSIYVAGVTQSVDLSTSPTSVQSQIGGRRDGFIARFDPALKQVLAITYLGGSGDDVIKAIAVTTNGDIVVAGQTRSVDFPYANAADVHGGTGFVIRLNPMLTAVTGSKNIGVTGATSINAIAIDVDGVILAVGETTDTTINGSGDGLNILVARLAPDLSTVNSIRIGGTGEDRANALALSPDGALYVAGRTESKNIALNPGVLQTLSVGADDGFVAKLNAQTLSLEKLGYFGGVNEDTITALHWLNDRLWVAGNSQSIDIALMNAAAMPMAGQNGFLIALDGNFSSSAFPVWVSGQGDDRIYALSSARDGALLFAGATRSSGLAIGPTALQSNPSGQGEGFLGRLLPNQSSQQITYLGGSLPDGIRAIASRDHVATLVGTTLSSDLPFLNGAAQPMMNGEMGAFAVVLPFDLSTRLDSTTSLNAVSTSAIYGEPISLTIEVTPISPRPAGLVRVEGYAELEASQFALVDGTVQFTKTDWLVGTHVLIAAYEGDDTYLPSKSNPATSITVSKAPTLTSFLLEPSSPLIGIVGKVHITVEVLLPSRATAVGEVELRVDGAVVAQGVLDSTGKTTLVLPALTTGTHTIRVDYVGNERFIQSISAERSVEPITAPWIIASPASLQFSAPNSSLHVTLTNEGNASWQPGLLSVSAPFTAMSACPDTLEPGASCTVTVSYHAMEFGQFDAELSIAGNQIDGPTTVALSADISQVYDVPALQTLAKLMLLALLLYLATNSRKRRYGHFSIKTKG